MILNGNLFGGLFMIGVYPCSYAYVRYCVDVFDCCIDFDDIFIEPGDEFLYLVTDDLNSGCLPVTMFLRMFVWGVDV